MNSPLHIVDHPLVQHKLTMLRRADLGTARFRQLTAEISALLVYEIMRDAPLTRVEVQTPLGMARGKKLAGKKIAFVGILRAGLGMLEGMLTVVPAARVGHIGIYRDRRLRMAVEYYLKLPTDMPERDVIVVASVLATGGSALAAVQRVKEAGARSVTFVGMVASRKGVDNFHLTYPDVPIYVAAVDEELNSDGFIVPGLGDVGDRLYGTE